MRKYHPMIFYGIILIGLYLACCLHEAWGDEILLRRGILEGCYPCGECPTCWRIETPLGPCCYTTGPPEGISDNMIIAYKASDGTLFESGEEMLKYDKFKKLSEIWEKWRYSRANNYDFYGERKWGYPPDFVRDNWPEIRAVMEGE